MMHRSRNAPYLFETQLQTILICLMSLFIHFLSLFPVLNLKWLKINHFNLLKSWQIEQGQCIGAHGCVLTHYCLINTPIH